MKPITPEEAAKIAKKQAREHKGKTKAKLFQSFDSFQELVEFGKLNAKHRQADNRVSRQEGTGYLANYFEFPSYEDACDKAASGWPGGTTRIKRISASLTEKVLATVKMQDFIYDDEGIFLDSERYAEGDPDCLMKLEEFECETRGADNIHIFMNAAASAVVDKAILANRGAAIVALTAGLSLAGKNVEVRVGCSNGTIETIFTAKALGDPLQIDQLAISVACGDVFRRFAFAAWERCENEDILAEGGIRRGGGYGYPMNCYEVDNFDIVLPTMIGYGDKGQFESEETTEKWVYAKLKQLGVELDGV